MDLKKFAEMEAREKALREIEKVDNQKTVMGQFFDSAVTPPKYAPLDEDSRKLVSEIIDGLAKDPPPLAPAHAEGGPVIPDQTERQERLDAERENRNAELDVLRYRLPAMPEAGIDERAMGRTPTPGAKFEYPPGQSEFNQPLIGYDAMPTRPSAIDYDAMVKGQWSENMQTQQAKADALVNELAKTIKLPNPVDPGSPTLVIEADFSGFVGGVPVTLVEDRTNLEALANLALPDAIARAEKLKAEIVDAERRLKDFLDAKVKAVALVEARVRAEVLANGASYTEAEHMKVNYVKAGTSVKWNGDQLMGFAAALNPDQKAGLLACRTVEVKPASTTITYK